MCLWGGGGGRGWGFLTVFFFFLNIDIAILTHRHVHCVLQLYSVDGIKNFKGLFFFVVERT